MPKFRKKPLIVDADQWFPHSPVDCVEHPVPDRDIAKIAALGENVDGPIGLIRTLEGPFVVKPGDWILTGVEGERWPVKPSIFEKSYERVGGPVSGWHCPNGHGNELELVHYGPGGDHYCCVECWALAVEVKCA